MALLLRVGIAIAAMLVAAPVSAQTFPDRPIRLVAPFPAGGLADVLARAVGDEMSKSLGQPVIVENRPGAGGNTGADAVAKAAPDGTTLLMSSAGILTANPFLYPKMPFDVETAFVPVSNVADMSMLVVTRANLEQKSLRDLVTFAHAHPGQLTFGSAGIGTTGHLGLAMFMHAAGIKLTHVPYRGAAPAVNDLIAGQIDGVVDNPPTVLPHIASGRLRALAVAARERLPLLPDVPTAAEAGVAHYEASSWFGIMAPAGTPAPIVERLHKEIAAAVRTSTMQQRFASSGARLLGDTPAEFAARIKTERAMWGEVIRAAGIKAE
ncbi:Bug family tripartite tricarboxylate transporter substrate binding protein [Rhodoplanes sp. Z2-YC6860]|uniref:Bug family tripartite tricarboxylate transporter substrate binding protein n=1 Tax=Rhodoplanes sp. Z2-YC6860 TaxID=674703 RepID=UPI00078E310F|nr:tripartite tricarboxylate transporter substrate binding protein [Rhodoplanes sp. Z2-YC6860]AMN45183.1 extra-cytoplasmic solute receptor [Rhodoplanes sp. Z2-YC6860]